MHMEMSEINQDVTSNNVMLCCFLAGHNFTVNSHKTLYYPIAYYIILAVTQVEENMLCGFLWVLVASYVSGV